MLLWIIFGGIAGWLASLIVGRGDQMGMLANIAVGVIGAFVGGWIADRMGFGGKPGVERPTSLVSFATAVLGAVILLVILNFLF
ncbi:GlsB/YeaQ/YmgE family stress response membrane protein [Methylocaldum sp.]|uniref:GlsB/YeaQ/YmgE family stress response membrane protein n=1 Tax=Methylocaldum sp. TaxID=1969727 RepID=UPI002D4AB326|nr:GlsB/YeaQ/YmgE family stress response membrane protein [Methylocaldum sp.]HYE37340.1 GlsB/YeaQ/YmgE family stress response membrane protein [Methylocaldum sp.]